MKHKYLVGLTCFLLLHKFCTADYDISIDQLEEWEEPNVWAQTKYQDIKLKSTNLDNSAECDCQQKCKQHEPVHQTDHTAFLYTKLVHFLLDRKQMKMDESTNTLHRRLHLSIRMDQIDRLEKISEIRDIDQLISDIFIQSKPGTLQQFEEMFLTWTDYLFRFWHSITISRQLIITVQVLIFLALYYANQRYQFGLWKFILFLVFYNLYMFLDSECYRKKEIERAAEILTGNGINPCESSEGFWSYYFGNSNEACKRHLSKTYNLECSMIDIYEELLNVLIYRQMWNFINNSVGNVYNIYSTHGIITTIIIVFIGTYLMKTIIKSTIKNVLTAPMSWRSSKKSTKSDDAHNRLHDNLDTILKITETQMKQTELLMNNLNNKRELQYSCVETVVESVEVKPTQKIIIDKTLLSIEGKSTNENSVNKQSDIETNSSDSDDIVIVDSFK